MWELEVTGQGREEALDKILKRGVGNIEGLTAFCQLFKEDLKFFPSLIIKPAPISGHPPFLVQIFHPPHYSNF